MNYTVKQMLGQGSFNVYVVKFSNKEFKFWMRNTTQVIDDVFVIFNNKYANAELRDGAVILSLDGLNNIQELYQAINIFKDIIKFQNMIIRFVVENSNQRQFAELLGNNLGISYVVIDTNVRENNNVNEIEHELKNEPNYTASGSKTIEVQKNTGLEKITVADNKAYVRVLKKDENKSSAFVSLPVIMFVLSAMLLIFSIMILFVLE